MMITCLIIEKDPAASAVIGSAPIRASGGGSGLVVKRSAKPHAVARPKPVGERGIRTTLSPVGSKSVAGLPSRPNPCVYRPL